MLSKIDLVSPATILIFNRLLTKYCLAFYVIVCCSCGNTREEIYREIEKFDTSLDSLITDTTYNERDYLIFKGDTLRNNPFMIEETYYQMIGTDSLKVEANGHVYRFDKCHLLMDAGEDFLGNKFVHKFIYFEDTIDNKLLDELWALKSDTIYIGRVRKYNGQGALLKSIETHKSQWARPDGSIVIDDYRLLEVYPYKGSDSTVTVLRKRYFNKQYSLDSLRATKTEQVTIPKRDSWLDEKVNYIYTLDKHGNWTAKRGKGENPTVSYRRYFY